VEGEKFRELLSGEVKVEKGERVYGDSVPLICRIRKWENPPVLNPSVWYLLQGLE
jgi:hypothetical protein